MPLTAERIIELLNLKALPLEGGFYRETYRSADVIPAGALPDRYTSDKAFATAIYYLLTLDTCSLLHRLPTDEVYHFYLGGPVTMLELHPDGSSEVITLGPDIEAGQRLQAVVPGGTWQGACLNESAPFALLGTTMCPGFDFSDFKLGNADVLTHRYPAHADLIARLTP